MSRIRIMLQHIFMEFHAQNTVHFCFGGSQGFSQALLECTHSFYSQVGHAIYSRALQMSYVDPDQDLLAVSCCDCSQFI